MIVDFKVFIHILMYVNVTILQHWEFSYGFPTKITKTGIWSVIAGSLTLYFQNIQTLFNLEKYWWFLESWSWFLWILTFCINRKNDNNTINRIKNGLQDMVSTQTHKHIIICIQVKPAFKPDQNNPITQKDNNQNAIKPSDREYKC